MRKIEYPKTPDPTEFLAMRRAPVQPPARRSDADRYQWIRANRGSYDITDALSGSNRDADFDARIDAAMHRSAIGRRGTCSLDELAVDSTYGPYAVAGGEPVDAAP